jgi:hypothetical protein
MTNNVKTSQKQHPIVLWSALVVSATCNAAMSIAGSNIAVSVVFGVLALLCGIGLVVHYRSR